jgi:TPR repeat protein
MAPSQMFRAQLAKAKKGNPEAQAFVFSCHYFGDEGVNKNLTLAFKFCRMAAEGGDTACQFSLGTFYMQDEEVERDERKASAWYLRAAKECGDPDAQFNTAQRYRSGIGHDAPDMKEAIKWYQAAVAQGHCGARFFLGNRYDEGEGVKMNRGLALKLWRKCAQHHHEKGDAEQEYSIAGAHNNIGHCYCRGSHGVEVDLPVAMQCWTKAAELEDIEAQCTIGAIYLMGAIKDVPVGTFDRDVPLGMKYLRILTTLADQKLEEYQVEATSEAEAIIREFHADKSWMGCGTPKDRKLCSGCLYHADHAKVWYCGEACQLIHWRHQTAECGSRAATRDGSGAG